MLPVPTSSSSSGAESRMEEKEGKEEDLTSESFPCFSSGNRKDGRGGGYEKTQRGFPVRAILSNPLSSPMEECELSAGGLPISPHREGKGVLAPPTAHTSFITAMAWLDIPSRILLSGARDGTIKFWK